MNVPIGLIDATWGGTSIQSWTPPEGFAEVPALKAEYELVRQGDPRTPEHAARLESFLKETESWLTAALATPFDGQTVVVTHFAPSLRSADPRYGLAPGTAGFCNALDELLPRAQLWLHGHLHCPSDYVDSSGPRHCRVVANPLGYAGNGSAEVVVERVRAGDQFAQAAKQLLQAQVGSQPFVERIFVKDHAGGFLEAQAVF